MNKTASRARKNDQFFFLNQQELSITMIQQFEL